MISRGSPVGVVPKPVAGFAPPNSPPPPPNAPVLELCCAPKRPDPAVDGPAVLPPNAPPPPNVDVPPPPNAPNPVAGFGAPNKPLPADAGFVAPKAPV